MDTGNKSLRHFYCRDGLWKLFERMSEELDKGMDGLVNEAMTAFAEAKGFSEGMEPGDDREAGGDEETPAPTPPSAPPAMARPAVPPPPPPPMARPSVPPPPPPAPQHRAPTSPALAPTLPPRAPAPRAPITVVSADPSAESPGTLFLVFQNQRYRVDKDQFIIGRGSKSSDLAIKDGNISRKHAAVIRRNGHYFIKDLGSTNGIEYKGMRIDNKRIDDGDVFHLCEYELRFTYRR